MFKSWSQEDSNLLIICLLALEVGFFFFQTKSRTPIKLGPEDCQRFQTSTGQRKFYGCGNEKGKLNREVACFFKVITEAEKVILIKNKYVLNYHGLENRSFQAIVQEINERFTRVTLYTFIFMFASNIYFLLRMCVCVRECVSLNTLKLSLAIFQYVLTFPLFLEVDKQLIYCT